MNYRSIHTKIAEVDKTIKDLIYSLAPLYKKEFSEEQRVTVPLFTALHSTSESILILLLNQALFDADILLRSVMEGTLKYCYLMNGTDSEKNEKYNEYRFTLSEIDRLTDHKKAKDAIEILKAFSQNNLMPFEIMILSDEEESELSSKYSSSKKNELSRKWSYQSLLKALAEDHEEYKSELGTLSTYATISHNCHFDWTGVSARDAEITSSPDGTNEYYDYIHALRILSNVLSLYLFRVIEYMRGNKYSSQQLIEKCTSGFNLASQLDSELNQMLENAGHNTD